VGVAAALRGSKYRHVHQTSLYWRGSGVSQRWSEHSQCVARRNLRPLTSLACRRHSHRWPPATGLQRHSNVATMRSSVKTTAGSPDPQMFNSSSPLASSCSCGLKRVAVRLLPYCHRTPRRQRVRCPISPRSDSAGRGAGLLVPVSAAGLSHPLGAHGERTSPVSSCVHYGIQLRIHTTLR
jgi:hypothetical protein